VLNIVIPMAGLGSRFSEASFKDPKPLIKIGKKTMIELVVANLKPNKEEANFIFICNSGLISNYYFDDLLSKLNFKHKIIQIDYLTDGPAETVNLAKNIINSNDELLIANCDQYIDYDIDEILQYARQNFSDGLILTMNDTNKKWSFIKKDNMNNVLDIKEKEVISNEATVGIYYFKEANYFFNAFDQMKFNKDKSNNEYYVGPSYNYLIKENKKINFLNIGKYRENMFGLGDPEDLAYFLKNFIGTVNDQA